MNYTSEEVLEYMQEEDVKFIRLAFADVFGVQKNISIMPGELERAFRYGIAFDASAIAGFGDETHSDLFLMPEKETLMPLPWRPEHGRVVQMFAQILNPDGSVFHCDTRALLKAAVNEAEKAGFRFSFGGEQEFYLFRLDDQGLPTKIPHDTAGYMDVSPEDLGENVRREICLTLEQMGIRPESSHHEEGPGQNEIDFRYADPVTAADQVMMFRRVVKTIAHQSGLFADFSPKPLKDAPGNGFHINMSLSGDQDPAVIRPAIAGILEHIREMTLFMNPSEMSYHRLGRNKAPRYISWSKENRSQLVRIPAASGEYQRLELRSPDPLANPYLAFRLMILAALDGIRKKLPLSDPADFNLYTAAPELLSSFERLPGSFDEACRIAKASPFIRSAVPEALLASYIGQSGL